jgi:hypothetical protein
MTARALWSPEVALRYGLRPWEMRLLTMGEYRELQRHHEALTRQDGV